LSSDEIHSAENIGKNKISVNFISVSKLRALVNGFRLPGYHIEATFLPAPSYQAKLTSKPTRFKVVEIR
jgi:hypothetical protein